MTTTIPRSTWQRTRLLHRLHLKQTDRQWQQDLAHRRLTQVYQSARIVPFDDTSRLCFFSDCHRGDNSRADAFAENESLFLHALEYYDRGGFAYVEVGDGDELWQNQSFGIVRRAHPRVFDWMHKLNRQGRLHLVLGNHEIQHHRQDRVEKDGLVAREGLVLQHVKTGQSIFVVHGHQADLGNDQFLAASRFVVRYLLRWLLLLGLVRATAWADDREEPRCWIRRQLVSRLQNYTSNIERKIMGWAHNHRQIVICGHTHRQASAHYGEALYLNTGSCIGTGEITGLEIVSGLISQVRWSAARGETKREILSHPRRLQVFA